MTVIFWAIAAALMAAALWFVIPPLLASRAVREVSRRDINLALYHDKLAELAADRAREALDDAQFEQARADLERQLLEDLNSGAPATAAARGRPAWLVPALALALPVGSVAFYLGQVTSTARLPQALTTPIAPAAMEVSTAGVAAQGMPLPPQGRSSLSMDEAAARLSARLEENPEDPDGWLLLGNSYRSLGRDAEAEAAFERARGLGATVPADDSRATAATPPVAAGLARLEQHLAEQPGDGAGWAQLGRGYHQLKRYSDAHDAYAKALAIDGKNADWLADAADAAAAVSRSLAGEPTQLVERALAVDPEHVKALWLAASAAHERGDETVALGLWQRLEARLDPDSPDARIVAANIAEARAVLSLGDAGAPGTAPQQVQGTVTVASSLLADVDEDDTLFVFARAVDGPPMPLAVLRKRAGDLPLQFMLDDSMAVMPTARLSTAREVVVGARISRSGNATPQPGDLVGVSTTVTVRDGTPVNIVIDHRS